MNKSEIIQNLIMLVLNKVFDVIWVVLFMSLCTRILIGSYNPVISMFTHTMLFLSFAIMYGITRYHLYSKLGDKK